MKEKTSCMRIFTYDICAFRFNMLTLPLVCMVQAKENQYTTSCQQDFFLSATVRPWTT